MGFPAWNGWNSSSGRRDTRAAGSATVRGTHRPFQPTKQTKMKDDALPQKVVAL